MDISLQAAIGGSLLLSVRLELEYMGVTTVGSEGSSGSLRLMASHRSGDLP
jgi:hypothetical protein